MTPTPSSQSIKFAGDIYIARLDIVSSDNYKVDITDQMIGIENMKLAKASYLADVMDNPNAYGRKLATFNKYADFRLFQEMTADDVAKMKAGMSESEIKNMSEKIKKAKELGIIQ
jgi:hypothetical protein